MTEKGIRVKVTEDLGQYVVSVIVDKREDADKAFTAIKNKEGIFFTDQQLAELKQEIWDAAREKIEQEEIIQYLGAGFRTRKVSVVDKYKDLKDYESKKGGQDG